VERLRQKFGMLQGYGEAVLHAKSMEKELSKARKHATLLQSKLDGAFSQYHNEVQEMQAKKDDLIRKNKSLRQKNKGMPPARLLSTYFGVPCSSSTLPWVVCRAGDPNGPTEGLRDRS
jgi:FtsZ-binding cell division protein ZapB